MHNPKMLHDLRTVFAGTKKAPILIAAVAVLCLPASSFAASAQRADDCASMKQLIQDAGKYLYRYTDPKHPSLQLYTLYVRSDSQCNVGEALEAEAVPLRDGCTIPTCVKQDTYGEH